MASTCSPDSEAAMACHRARWMPRRRSTLKSTPADSTGVKLFEILLEAAFLAGIEPGAQAADERRQRVDGGQPEGLV